MGYLTDGLTFNTLRGGNLRRVNQFKNANGDLAHNGGGVDDWSINDWATAIGGEAGELQNMCKKIRRGDYTLEEKREEVADEMADVVIYLDLLAARCGIDLGRAVMSKFNKTSRKQDLPTYLAADDWHTTDRGA